MLWTSFSPGLDGAGDWDFTGAGSQYTWPIERAFRAARTRVLEELHGPYFNAVETFNLARHTGRWIDCTPLQVFARDAGKVYATLDYFYACLPLPSRLKALGDRKEAVFHRYFRQRSLENIQANTAGLLRALAIATLIPNEWFPKKELENLIKNKIRQIGIYRQVEVDCQMHLAPGGLRWLAGETMQAVQKIREKLAAGQPWPVRLIRSPEDLLANRQAIVYACRERPDRKLRLEICEPDCVLDEHALLLDTRKDPVEIVERSRPGPSLPVLGLLWEAYSPAAPPLACSPWWLRNESTRPIWRRVRRIFSYGTASIFTVSPVS